MLACVRTLAIVALAAGLTWIGAHARASEMAGAEQAWPPTWQPSFIAPDPARAFAEPLTSLDQADLAGRLQPLLDGAGVRTAAPATPPAAPFDQFPVSWTIAGEDPEVRGFAGSIARVPPVDVALIVRITAARDRNACPGSHVWGSAPDISARAAQRATSRCTSADNDWHADYLFLGEDGWVITLGHFGAAHGTEAQVTAVQDRLARAAGAWPP